jgi:hypothetical protein
MLVSRVTYGFLTPSIALITTIVMALPLFGALYPVLGTPSDPHFWDPLKFAKLWSFDSSIRIVFERMSAWHVI